MEEKKRVLNSLFFPTLFLILIWLIKLFEIFLGTDFIDAGVMPRTVRGLQGILFSPLIHGDWKHLFDNSIPVFLLTFALFYFYRGIAFTIYVFVYITGGAILWIIGRDAYHIGASGIIYGLASFLFLSGVIRGVRHLMAISLLVVFIYGSLIWGLLPFDYEVSWEGHLSGAVVGVALALLYRDQGPEPEKPSWELEEEAEDDVENGIEGEADQNERIESGEKNEKVKTEKKEKKKKKKRKKKEMKK
jgi:membrane associated rhomboid family serine protease